MGAKSICVALAALCLAGLAGCAGQRINVWPVFFRETELRGQEPVTTVEVLYPLLSIERSPSRSYHVLRPLYNYERNLTDGSSRTQYLWPLGLATNRPEDLKLDRFLPIFQHYTRAPAGAGEGVTHSWLLPLLFWGRTPEEGPYFAFFPVGGVTHGLLGDTLAFAAFPLYAYLRDGDYRCHFVLWPIFSWGSSPDGKLLRRGVWPLYVRDRVEGLPGGGGYAKNSVLWFLLRWGRQWAPGPGGREERRYFALFPLYSDQVLRDSEGNLLSRQRRVLQLVGWSVDNRERNYERGVTFLFGQWRFVESQGLDEWRMIPFYWRITHYRLGQRDPEHRWTRHRILWPLIWLDNNTMDPGRRARNIVVAPLYWDFVQESEAGGARRRERSISLWPLLTVGTDSEGRLDLWLLSHGWRDSAEGYKRNYRAFFDLFQFHSTPAEEGGREREVRLLWRLCHYKGGPQGRYVSFQPLMTYDGRGDAGAGGEKSWSFLLGLVKYAWTEEGGRWRLLYVPLGRRPEASGEAVEE